jgi:hypothetical protein
MMQVGFDRIAAVATLAILGIKNQLGGILSFKRKLTPASSGFLNWLRFGDGGSDRKQGINLPRLLGPASSTHRRMTPIFTFVTRDFQKCVRPKISH